MSDTSNVSIRRAYLGAFRGGHILLVPVSARYYGLPNVIVPPGTPGQGVRQLLASHVRLVENGRIRGECVWVRWVGAWGVSGKPPEDRDVYTGNFYGYAPEDALQVEGSWTSLVSHLPPREHVGGEHTDYVRRILHWREQKARDQAACEKALGEILDLDPLRTKV